MVFFLFFSAFLSFSLPASDGLSRQNEQWRMNSQVSLFCFIFSEAIFNDFIQSMSLISDNFSPMC
jgi:hypothetical protein